MCTSQGARHLPRLTPSKGTRTQRHLPGLLRYLGTTKTSRELHKHFLRAPKLFQCTKTLPRTQGRQDTIMHPGLPKTLVIDNSQSTITNPRSPRHLDHQIPPRHKDIPEDIQTQRHSPRHQNTSQGIETPRDTSTHLRKSTSSMALLDLSTTLVHGASSWELSDVEQVCDLTLQPFVLYHDFI